MHHLEQKRFYNREIGWKSLLLHLQYFIILRGNCSSIMKSFFWKLSSTLLLSFTLSWWPQILAPLYILIIPILKYWIQLNFHYFWSHIFAVKCDNWWIIELSHTLKIISNHFWDSIDFMEHFSFFLFIIMW